MPVAIVTGDYFLDDAVSRELHSLGAEVRFKPLWLEDLLALAGNLLKHKNGSSPQRQRSVRPRASSRKTIVQFSRR